MSVNQFLVCMYFISGRAVDDVIIADVCLATSSLVMCVIDVSDIYLLHGFHISFAYVYMTVFGSVLRSVVLGRLHFTVSGF